MTLSEKQLLHVRVLQDRITQSQDELGRFVAYILAECGADPRKQYMLSGQELIEVQSPNAIKLQ